MFGLVVKDGMEWSGVVTNQIPLFGFVKNKWSGMEGVTFILSLIIRTLDSNN
jgi:hypothetical protein